jgi:uncharacterized protein (TIGR02246 family)
MSQTDPLAIASDVLDRAERAWNAGDGAAFGALFADGSDFVNIRGDHHRGKDAIGRGHQAIFDTIYAGSTVSYRAESARPLGPGHILAIAGATLEAPGGPLRGTNHSRATLVLADTGERWEVTAFHNTLLAQRG